MLLWLSCRQSFFFARIDTFVPDLIPFDRSLNHWPLGTDKSPDDNAWSGGWAKRKQRWQRHLASINTSPAICYLSTPSECPTNKNKCRIVNETSHSRCLSTIHSLALTHTHSKFSPCPKELTLNKYTADVCWSQGRKNKWVCSFLSATLSSEKGEERKEKSFLRYRNFSVCEEIFPRKFDVDLRKSGAPRGCPLPDPNSRAQIASLRQNGTNH